MPIILAIAFDSVYKLSHIIAPYALPLILSQATRQLHYSWLAQQLARRMPGPTTAPATPVARNEAGGGSVLQLQFCHQMADWVVGKEPLASISMRETLTPSPRKDEP